MSYSERIVKRVLTPTLSRAVYQRLARLVFRGDACYCPVCESHVSKFLPRQGIECRCPVCFSEPRHRLVMLYMEDCPELFGQGPVRFLHAAPELCMRDWFRRQTSVEYTGADLDSHLADVHTDFCAMRFGDDSFDAIYCSHVLEHIPDDRAAMAECWRVLRPGGGALFMVPMRKEDAFETFEAPADWGPERRCAELRHPDHKRLYGRDFKDRLEAAGFQVEEIDLVAGLDGASCRRHGLWREWIYRCTKGA